MIPDTGAVRDEIGTDQALAGTTAVSVFQNFNQAERSFPGRDRGGERRTGDARSRVFVSKRQEATAGLYRDLSLD